MDAAQTALAGLLMRSKDPRDEAGRRAAVTQLTDSERAPGFLMTLLTITGNAAASMDLRVTAAAYFRRVVRMYWAEPEPEVISAVDRGTIKEHLIGLMCAVPVLVQRQLSDALTIISKRDFPHAWEGLLPALVARLGGADIGVTVGLLETAAAIFERFRDAPNTDPVRAEILYSLTNFAEPLRAVTAMLLRRLDEGTAAREGAAALTPPLTGLRLCVSCWQSLSWIELPEVFDDHLAEWMGVLRRCLTYSNAAAFPVDPEDNERTPLLELQAAALDVVIMMADKHDEEFEPFFDTFAGDVWALLSGATVGPAIMAPALDDVVMRAVKYITAAVASPAHGAALRAPAGLAALVQQVVVPNIRSRPSDVEEFEDNPVSFAHRDIEGSDSDTRRRAASDLVRALCRAAEAEAPPIMLAQVNAMLASYAASPAAREVDKDAAIALLIATAVKTQTAAMGVTALVPGVAVADYLRDHVVPELNPAAVDALPLAKAAALKFLTVFRAQLSRENMAAVLPLAMPFIGARSVVVHTYAAAFVDRLLTVKDRVQKSALQITSTLRLRPEDIAPHLGLLVPGLIGILTSGGAGAGADAASAAAGDVAENDYMMRAFMRVVSFSGAAMTPFAPAIIEGLTKVLARVCANPSSATFNHYLFETVACLMRNLCGANPDLVRPFEGMLLPPFNAVISADVVDFLPYVFQLFAELLNLYPAPAAGGHSLSEAFQGMLPTLLDKGRFWARPGNVPALALLMAAYVRRGAVFMAAGGHMPALLALWQHLLVSKNEEEHSFTILNAMFESAPPETYGSFLPPILQSLALKLKASRSAKAARAFTHSVCLFAGEHGAAVLAGAMNAVADGFFWQALDNIILGQAPHVIGREARAETVVGLGRILSETPALLADPARHGTLGKLLAVASELLEGRSGSGAVDTADSVVGGATSDATFFEDRDTGDLVEEAVAGEYAAAFARLLFAAEPRRMAFAARVPDTKAFIGQSIVALSAAAPGALGPMIAASPAAVPLGRYIAASGAALR